MTTPNHARPSLDDVLEQYMVDGPSYETLNDYVRRFPEHRDALSNFTVKWSAMEHADIEGAVDDDPDMEEAIATVRGFIHEGTTTEPTPNAEAGALPSPAVPQLVSPVGSAPGAPTESLEDMLVRLGIDLFDFEDRSRLDYSVLINLSMGGFTFDSPEEKDCVARALLGHIRTFDPDPIPPLPAVRRSISMPPTIAAGQSSSPESKPGTVTKSFRRGIEDACDMTDEDKAAWLRILDEAC